MNGTPPKRPVATQVDIRLDPARKRLLRLVESRGGQRKAAHFLGVSPAVLNKFINHGVVPVSHQDCRAMGIPRKCWKHAEKRPPHPEPVIVRKWRRLPKDARRKAMEKAVKDYQTLQQRWANDDPGNIILLPPPSKSIP